MTAYVIVRVNVTDPDQYSKYKLLTPGAIAKYGGTFLVRGGAHEVLEGPADDRRMVLLEFPSMDHARSFYDSPEYREARAVRDGAAEMELVAIEGIPT